MLLMLRPLCADDVLQMGECGKTATADEWRLTKLNKSMWAIVLGRKNKFVACWDIGDGWRDPYWKEDHPLRKTPFPAGKLPSIMGCGWRKVTHKANKIPHHGNDHGKGHGKDHDKGHIKGHEKGHGKVHKKFRRPRQGPKEVSPPSQGLSLTHMVCF